MLELSISVLSWGGENIQKWYYKPIVFPKHEIESVKANERQK
jgi:hypothetical protein